MPCSVKKRAHSVSLSIETSRSSARSFRLCHSPSLIAVKSFSLVTGLSSAFVGC